MTIRLSPLHGVFLTLDSWRVLRAIGTRETYRISKRQAIELQQMGVIHPRGLFGPLDLTERGHGAIRRLNAALTTTSETPT